MPGSAVPASVWSLAWSSDCSEYATLAGTTGAPTVSAASMTATCAALGSERIITGRSATPRATRPAASASTRSAIRPHVVVRHPAPSEERSEISVRSGCARAPARNACTMLASCGARGTVDRTRHAPSGRRTVSIDTGAKFSTAGAGGVGVLPGGGAVWWVMVGSPLIVVPVTLLLFYTNVTAHRIDVEIVAAGATPPRAPCSKGAPMTDTSPAPAAIPPIALDTVDWIIVGSGVYLAPLHEIEEGAGTALLRFDEGAVSHQHTHPAGEEMYVISGK